MSSKPFNAVDGVSVGLEIPIVVIQANGDVTANNLIVDGKSDLGNIGNVKITGGVNGQVIGTDGLGNLTFRTVSAVGNSTAPMPFFIPNGESYIVPTNFQGLFGQPIDIEGTLEVDGILFDVTETNPGTGVANTQIPFVDNDHFLGSQYFTYAVVSRTLNVSNISLSGNIIPTANDTYTLGNETNRFSNLYLSGNTIKLGNAVISANSTTLVLMNPDGSSFSSSEVSGESIIGAVSNAVFSTYAGTAYSISAANVSGLGNISTLNIDGNSGNVLRGNGTWGFDGFKFTALSITGTTTLSAPVGSYLDGDRYMLRFKDNGTPWSLVWSTSLGNFRPIGVTLPATTDIGKTFYISCVYNAADNYWDVLSVIQQA